MAKKKKKKKALVRTNRFLSMLKRIHLGGVFEECILDVKKGKGKVTAVDITNSMIVIAQDTIASKNISGEFGLGNLELLVKFFSSIEDEKMIFRSAKNYFTIRRKDGRRKLEYLLTQPELIATRFQEEEEDETPYEKISKVMEYSISLDSSFAKDFLTYIGLLKTKNVNIVYDGDEGVSFVCGSREDHRFEIRLDSEVESDGEGEEFVVKINGEHLSKILSVIDYDEEDPPTMSFAEDKPVMIEEGGTAWVIVPIIDIEEGQEED